MHQTMLFGLKIACILVGKREICIPHSYLGYEIRPALLFNARYGSQRIGCLRSVFKSIRPRPRGSESPKKGTGQTFRVDDQWERYSACASVCYQCISGASRLFVPGSFFHRKSLAKLQYLHRNRIWSNFDDAGNLK